jgi:4-amino-4-deoxy-L-arabinose transferase-like glycosyltransferase
MTPARALPALASRVPRFELTIIALAFAVRVVVAFGTDLYFDESYYWLWGRNLDIGYYDHPPLIAWILAFVPVRLASLTLGAATTIAVWMLARRVHGCDAAAWRAAALWCAVPAGALAGIIATPDSPLYLFWILALWAARENRWVWAGGLSGAALLSKYSAVLLAVVFALHFARTRRIPTGALAGAGLAALLFVPVLVWNAAHDWAGFGFQLKQGFGGTGYWRSPLKYVASQLVMGGPVLSPMALAWAFCGPGQAWMLRAATWVPQTFFCVAATSTRSAANWPSAAYLSACVGLASVSQRWTRIATIAGMMVIVAGASHVVAPLAWPARDPTLPALQGWSSLRELRLMGPRVVFASTYRLASEVTYYAGLETHVAGRRKQQFRYWPEPVLAPGENALWISEGSQPPSRLQSRFAAVVGPRFVHATYASRTVHVFHVWTLMDFQDETRTSHWR